jgi:hypothetical protein
MERDRLLEEFAHCERMKTLTGQTATTSTFAAITSCISAFLGGHPLLGLPVTALAAALFAGAAYATWRSHEHYVGESRSIEKQLTNSIPRDMNQSRAGFSGVVKAPERMSPQRSRLLH